MNLTGSISGGSGHKGLGPERVIEAATELTRQRGLTGWSVRDLAGALGVATSAIYHHVGDRGAVIREVVRGLIDRAPRADPMLDWQDWFEQTLLGLWSALRDHRGVAHWFMMHGPVLEEATDIVDAGIAALERAGFGERTAYAYALMFNQTIGAVALVDDRLAPLAADGDRRLAAMADGFADLTPSSHGLAVLTHGVLQPMIQEPGALEEYLRSALRTTISGLAVELRS